MKKRYNFLEWLLLALLSMLIQTLGNTSIPELEGMGIVVAILLLISMYMDTQNYNENQRH